MKRKEYEKPAMKIVKMQQQCHILAGSNGQTGVQDYDWTTIPEE